MLTTLITAWRAVALDTSLGESSVIAIGSLLEDGQTGTAQTKVSDAYSIEVLITHCNPSRWTPPLRLIEAICLSSAQLRLRSLTIFELIEGHPYHSQYLTIQFFGDTSLCSMTLFSSLSTQIEMPKIEQKSKLQQAAALDIQNIRNSLKKVQTILKRRVRGNHITLIYTPLLPPVHSGRSALKTHTHTGCSKSPYPFPPIC